MHNVPQSNTLNEYVVSLLLSFLIVLQVSTNMFTVTLSATILVLCMVMILNVSILFVEICQYIKGKFFSIQTVPILSTYLLLAPPTSF